jgi:hypothetical protein
MVRSIGNCESCRLNYESEFLLWLNSTNPITILFTLIGGIIVFIPLIVFFGMFIIALFKASSSGNGNNDCGWL